MDYSNPEIPEGINYSTEHPLKEFLLLAIGVFGTLAIVLLVLGVLADRLAHHLPYSLEKDAQVMLMGSTDNRQPIVAYLQGLADRIALAQGLPEEMPITVHYSQEPIVNAYASLGGHVVMFRGLLEKLPNENALALVMAHEVAHIRHRHPIRSLGSGVVIGLTASVLSQGLGDAIVSRFIGTTGTLTSLRFSRDHEREADETAIETLRKIYGHLAGAEELFVLFRQLEGDRLSPEFFNTHPDSQKRLQRLLQEGSSDGDATSTALPEGFASWLAMLAEHNAQN